MTSDAVARLVRQEGPGVLATLIRVGLDGYPWWHASRAELLRELGEQEAARLAYERALAIGMSAPQERHVRRRLLAGGLE